MSFTERLKVLGKTEMVRDRFAMNTVFPVPTPLELEEIDRLTIDLSLDNIILQTNGISVRYGQHIDNYLVYLICADSYEFGDLRLINEHASKANQVVVLGGGIGIIASALARKTGAPVLVFDANPSLLPHIVDTGNLNGVSLIAKHGAIARHGGKKAQFQLSAEFWASSLNENTHRRTNTIEVPTISFLEALGDAETVFIDIECGEADLFFDPVPSTLREIFIEIHTPVLGHKIKAAIMNRIWQQGFQLVDSDGLTSFWRR